MHENLVLFLFILLPPTLLILSYVFITVVRNTPNAKRLSMLALGNALILCTLLSFAMLGGEIYYRFIYDQTDSFGLCKTTTRWFDRHFQRNMTGFRDSYNYLPQVPQGKRRISFVGDSFTAGHGIKNVEDRFANRIRQIRSQHEVHVLAECGLDTGRELELVEFLPKSGYECDVVVLVYCLNDISDIVPEWQGILDRIYHQPEPGFFAENSYLFNTFQVRQHMRQTPDVVDYYSFIRQAYEGDIWQEQQARLTELQQAIEEAGGELMVVTFPFFHELGSDYPYQEIHDQLNDFWKERNVPHLDLLATFQEMTPEAVTLNPRDVHPNELAHSMAANSIAEFLDEHLNNRDVSSPLSVDEGWEER